MKQNIFPVVNYRQKFSLNTTHLVHHWRLTKFIYLSGSLGCDWWFWSSGPLVHRCPGELFCEIGVLFRDSLVSNAFLYFNVNFTTIYGSDNHGKKLIVLVMICKQSTCSQNYNVYVNFNFLLSSFKDYNQAQNDNAKWFNCWLKNSYKKM